MFNCTSAFTQQIFNRHSKVNHDILRFHFCIKISFEQELKTSFPEKQQRTVFCICFPQVFDNETKAAWACWDEKCSEMQNRTSPNKGPFIDSLGTRNQKHIFSINNVHMCPLIIFLKIRKENPREQEAFQMNSDKCFYLYTDECSKSAGPNFFINW